MHAAAKTSHDVKELLSLCRDGSCATSPRAYRARTPAMLCSEGMLVDRWTMK
jgi:hypothetical protein